MEAVVIQTKDFLSIGKQIKLWWDPKNEYYESPQPAVVLKESSFEEYVEYWKEDYIKNISLYGPLPQGRNYYLVSTD